MTANTSWLAVAVHAPPWLSCRAYILAHARDASLRSRGRRLPGQHLVREQQQCQWLDYARSERDTDWQATRSRPARPADPHCRLAAR